MNQRVLITGASHGIGKAAAERFAKEGCTLILNCRQSVEELSALESVSYTHLTLPTKLEV